MDDMNIKYGKQVKYQSFEDYCHVYLVNKIFKLLPLKEQGLEWESYLNSLNEELTGADEVFLNNVDFMSLVSKLEGLRFVQSDDLYRKTIFECISSVKSMSNKLRWY